MSSDRLHAVFATWWRVWLLVLGLGTAGVTGALLPPVWAGSVVLLLILALLPFVHRSTAPTGPLPPDVVHEILNPLATATAHVSAVADDPTLGEEDRVSLERALTGVERARRMLREAGDSRTVRATGLVLQQVDLSSLMKEALEDFSPLAAPRHVSMSLHAPPTLTVQADASRLRQVLDNLLSNAVKYNHDDGWVDVVLTETDHVAVLTVENPGQGLSEAELPHVFTDSFRGRAATSSEVLGSGLGLGACHRIVTAHRGRIEVQSSEETSTTTVRVVLPLPR